MSTLVAPHAHARHGQNNIVGDSLLLIGEDGIKIVGRVFDRLDLLKPRFHLRDLPSEPLGQWPVEYPSIVEFFGHRTDHIIMRLG
nr:hypothetical protein [Pseudaminobacter arsenicus]